jgi:hypothetical protein
MPVSSLKGRDARLPILILLALCCIFFVAKGFHDERLALQGFDFKPVYSGARCLFSHCNPYNSDDLRKAYIEGGGSKLDDRPFRPFNANYPPSALFWAIPFALLPWNIALNLWLSISAALFVTAAFLVANLCLESDSQLSIALLGFFVASSTILMMLAQPTGPAIGLCVIGVWCILQKRTPAVCIVCFALSLTLKPQLGGLIWLYFLLSGGYARRRALQIMAATILFCIPGILWASLMPQATHWPTDLQANLVGIAAHGNASDPGPANPEASVIANLQAAVSVFRDDRAYDNLISFCVAGSLILIWVLVAVRAPESRRKDLLGIAAIAYLCLLPIYHRQYDTRLLLLTFPAMGLLASEGGITGVFAVITALATIACTNHAYPRIMAEHFRLQATALGPFKTVILTRPIPVVLLLGAIFYLACFMRTLNFKQSQ